MWAKDENGNIVEGVEIDLSKAISATVLEEMSKITKTISVDLTKTNTIKQEVEGKKITTTVGKVALEESEGKYEYAAVKETANCRYAVGILWCRAGARPDDTHIFSCTAKQ